MHADPLTPAARRLPVSITHYTATCAAGSGRTPLALALQDNTSALTPNHFTPQALPTWIGRVHGLEAAPLPPHLQAWRGRNNELAWLALQQDGFTLAVEAAKQRYEPHRIGVILGTSTSSIGTTEAAYTALSNTGEFAAEEHRPLVHTPHAPGLFVQAALGLSGPCFTVSTACSSSAKVFGHAQRLLQLGVLDAVLVGGVDSLCASVLFGFNALNLVARDPCRPFDTRRAGISIGEAAGFALLERDVPSPLQLLACGESSDAFHMSSPHPEGLGARLAVQSALQQAGLQSSDLDYLNLHGTASQKNDEVESALLQDLYPSHIHASATKGLTGHALGAAGILEAVICLLCLETGRCPGTPGTQSLSETDALRIRLAPAQRPVSRAISHSFGFGGNNAVLIFGRQENTCT